MNFFGFRKAMDINDGLEKIKHIHGAVPLDVRAKEEYNEVHIPGSRNIPLNVLETVEDQIPNKSTPVFLHCLSGGRSRPAVRLLKLWGYANVTDLGGIHQYHGKIVRGAIQ